MKNEFFLFRFTCDFGMILPMKTEIIPDIEILKTEIKMPEEEIASLTKKLDLVLAENTLLKEQLEWFKRQIFGKKSEKVVASMDTGVMYLPGLEQYFLDDEGSNESSEKDKDKPKSRKKPVRDAKDAIKLPPDLPVKTIVLDLTEEEKLCKETGASLVKIGEDITCKLAYTPGSYFIKKIIRFKYAHPTQEENGILSPELPPTIFPKCRADDSLLAEILVKKFADHLPLYRISEILFRDGIGISRKLLSQWVVYCGNALTPLYDEMVKQVLASGNIFVDESPINVQVKSSVKKGFMWVIVGGNETNPPYRIYDFREDRKYENIFEILKDYEGVFHSDKYGAYVSMSKKGQIIWCPCWAHIRRYFFEAESGDPEFRSWVLRKIRYLYMLEKVAWNRSPEERIRIRLEKEAPIIDEIIKKITNRASEGNLLPKSKLSQAIHYFLGLVPCVKNYINHAYARLDNNVAERAVRPLAIGRKNWLFFGSVDAGQCGAVIFSLIQTCRGLGINPQEYLEDIFKRLLDHNASKLYELLPDQWLLRRHQPSK
jgi:transposase